MGNKGPVAVFDLRIVPSSDWKLAWGYRLLGQASSRRRLFHPASRMILGFLTPTRRSTVAASLGVLRA